MPSHISKCILLVVPFITGFALSADAATVRLNLSTLGMESNGTKLLRADLTGFGLTQVDAIQVVDDNTPVGGSAGIFSGFDLDGLYLDRDGDITTTGDQIYASSFSFLAGTTRATTDPTMQATAAHPGPTFGSFNATTVDLPTATLNVIGDGVNIAHVNRAAGFLTLGDGGEITAQFGPVTVGKSLYVMLGEQGGQLGENSDVFAFARDKPEVIPLPAAGWLLAGGLGALAMIGRWARRRP